MNAALRNTADIIWIIMTSLMVLLALPLGIALMLIFTLLDCICARWRAVKSPRPQDWSGA